MASFFNVLHTSLVTNHFYLPLVWLYVVKIMHIFSFFSIFSKGTKYSFSSNTRCYTQRCSKADRRRKVKDNHPTKWSKVSISTFYKILFDLIYYSQSMVGKLTLTSTWNPCPNRFPIAIIKRPRGVRLYCNSSVTVDVSVVVTEKTCVLLSHCWTVSVWVLLIPFRLRVLRSVG